MKRYLLTVAWAFAGLMVLASVLSCWSDAVRITSRFVFISVFICAAAVGVGMTINNRVERAALSFVLEWLSAALIAAATYMPLELLRADLTGFAVALGLSAGSCGVCWLGARVSATAEAWRINEELERRRRQ